MSSINSKNIFRGPPDTNDRAENSSLGSRIKELRKRAGISQQMLADVTGVSRAAISLFEIGTSKPSSETLSRLSDALQVEMEYLLGKNQVSVAKPDSGSNTATINLPFLAYPVRASLIEQEVSTSSTLQLTLNSSEEVTRYADALVFEVGEDHMQPLLHAGDKVITWPVPEAEWAQVYNQVCVIAYEQTVTIKAIRENELLMRGFLTLYAQNPAAGFLSIQREQIKGIWRVEEFFERPKIRL